MTARFPETSDRSVESELGSARDPSHAAGVKLEPIAPEVLERVRDDAHNSASWAIVRALLNAPADVTLAKMAKRSGHRKSYIERKLLEPRLLTFEDLSDFALALGGEFDAKTRKRGEWPKREQAKFYTFFYPEIRGAVSGLALLGPLNARESSREEPS